MEKDIILPVNVSMLQAELKEQEQKYEKRIADLEYKLKKILFLVKGHKIADEVRLNAIVRIIEKGGKDE